MKKFTKIVATISDKRCDEAFIKSLYENGLNVVRMNSAHLQREGFEKIVRSVRGVSEKIAILMDTKGPEVRTTITCGDTPIEIHEGEKMVFTGEPEGETTAGHICLSYAKIAEDVNAGKHFLIDDGELDFLIERVEGEKIYSRAMNDGTLGSRKSVNIPGVAIRLPSLTPRDIINIGYAIDMDVDFIAHSFVRSKQDILDIQRILDSRGSDIKIIAKIENQEGIDNFDEILDAAYGIMIARGDLGIEIPAERIPGIQNELVRKCIARHKPVIVATQMLHSMISNPRPTRAEVSDIANAVYQRTDALMLSGETAYGKYAVEAITTMAKVAVEAEHTLSTIRNSDEMGLCAASDDITSFLAKQAVASCSVVGSHAILTDSYTGRTARYIASFRGNYPTIALCYYRKVTRLLALSYGVFPIYQKRDATSRDYLYHGIQHLIDSGLITANDTIAYIGGAFGEGKGTSFLEINNVAEILKNYESYLLPNLEDTKECKKN